MKLIKNTVSTLLCTCILIACVFCVYRLFPLKHVGLIRTCADEAGVDKYLVAALIKAESNFNSNAISVAGAKGIMQLTDETAQFCAEKEGIELSEGDIFNPAVNIKLGVYYLKRTLDLFNQDEVVAIAAYNAGEGRVREWLNDPTLSPDGKSLGFIPYEETKHHIEKINNYKKIYKLLYPNL